MAGNLRARLRAMLGLKGSGVDADRFSSIQDIQMTFGTPHGERVLARLKKLAGYDAAKVPIGNDGHLDVHELVRNEGQRSVVVHIVRQMNIDLSKDQPTETISKERL